jgi:hypothetical protein
MGPFPAVDNLGQYFLLLTPVAALAVNAVAQVLLVRLQRGRHFLRAQTGAILVGGIALVAFDLFSLQFQVGESAVVSLWINIPTYLALSYCFFHFVNLGHTSIRIRIYAEIAERPGGMSAEEMARQYQDEALMQVRLRRLIESGDIVEKGGRYLVGKRRLVQLGNIIFTAKRFVLGKASEFDTGSSS